jgi:molybdenum cofactor guanylyltransferase
MSADTLGAVLAGGRGSRLGGGKALVELGGRPLIEHPLEALAAAGLDTVVVAKPGEELRGGISLLAEPLEPRHPLCGIVTALRLGRPVVAIACDLPFVAPELIELLAAAPEPLVVPTLEGRPQPLLARYGPSLLPRLEAALAREEPLARTVEALAPRFLSEEEVARFGDPQRLLFNVNDREDLRRAEALLR